MIDKEYSLTIAHVKQFLATKKDDDIIGFCWNSLYCLLSETLNWLYPEKSPWRVDMNDYSAPSVSAIYLNLDLLRLRTVFDFSGIEGPTTKGALKEHLQYIEAYNGLEAAFFGLPSPVSDFPVSDLFESDFEIAKKFQINEEDIGSISFNSISGESQERAYNRLCFPSLSDNKVLCYV